MDQNVEFQKNKMSARYAADLPNEVVEQQTKKVPNLLFLGLAGLSMLGSAGLTFGTQKKTLGNFVGLWVPTLLMFGIYNKIVKLEDELLRKDRKLH